MTLYSPSVDTITQRGHSLSWHSKTIARQLKIVTLYHLPEERALECSVFQLRRPSEFEVIDS